MGLFSRGHSTSMLTQLRDGEADAAEASRKNAKQVADTGKPIYGIGVAGWKNRAKTFQDAADDYQKQIDRKKR
jgi:hypothetical protein